MFSPDQYPPCFPAASQQDWYHRAVKRRRRLIPSILTLLSLLLCIATCVLWVRGRTGYDEAEWTYDRYLTDRSAASNHVHFTSDKRLWLDINWGHVGPFNGQLVWGYYVNADQSGGHPRFSFRHEPYDALLLFLKFDF